MKKLEIPSNVTRAFHKAAFKLKKHSPEILVVAGVVGAVGSAVMACKATLKVNEVLEEAKENIDKIHEAVEKGETQAHKPYTLEDSKKELGIVYIQTGWELAKLYGPSLIVGSLSVSAILTGHNITRQRNIALAAGYTALETSFKEYRGRVVDRFGEALDRELKHGVKAVEVDEIVTNEDGSESVTKKQVEVVDPNGLSLYARMWDDGCKGWTKNPEYNLMFLRQQQEYWNGVLKRKGHVFLNEVFDSLGIPRCEHGCFVGWIYDEKNPIGDNFIDFGIYDVNSEAKRNFVNGYERTILLDFNVDGKISHLI